MLSVTEFDRFFFFDLLGLLYGCLLFGPFFAPFGDDGGDEGGDTHRFDLLLLLLGW